ncbi:MAG: Cof-type HAD-IIB family hydrolase [Symbiobacteriia bacterium]
MALAVAEPFPDILAPDLDVVMVGFNPGLRSGATGHHYAGRGNRFWELLFTAGLTPVLLSPEQDRDLLQYGIGSTNLVVRPTAGSSDLGREEMRLGAREVLAKVRRLRPRAVCYLGKGVYQAILLAAGSDANPNAPVGYGPCPRQSLPGTLEFLAPNPSGRSAMPWSEKLAWYQRLAASLGRRPAVRLLLLDADGTALNEQGLVSRATRQAIEAARQRGVRVVLCTGRMHSSAAAIAAEAGLDDPVLSCNGALARGRLDGNVWWRTPVEQDDIPTLLAILEEYRCAFEFYVTDHMYTSRRSFSLRSFWSWNRPRVRHAWRLLRALSRDLRLVRLRPLADWPGTPDELPEKVMVSHLRPERLTAVAQALKAALPGRLEMSRSGDHYLEITRAGVHKGAGAQRLATALGLAPDAVMAIGDQGNDLAMLRWAGIGVAMGHAPDAVKAAADAVTGSNGGEEGVSQAIRRFILDD